MIYEVWHMITPQHLAPFSDEKLRLHHFKIAEVEADSPEEAYRLTNNIDAAWMENPEVTMFAEGEGFRSSMIGDFFRPEGTEDYIVVASCGFVRSSDEFPSP